MSIWTTQAAYGFVNAARNGIVRKVPPLPATFKLASALLDHAYARDSYHGEVWSRDKARSRK